MDIDFMVQDSFALTRPQWKLVTDFEEAGRLFANLVKQNYRSQGQEKAPEPEPAEDEASSSDEADGEDAPVPEMDDGQESSDEAEAEVSQGASAFLCVFGLTDAQPMSNGDTKHDSDFEGEIVVTRQEEERDPEAEAEFDRELAKMMSESLDSRKFERKPLFDVPLPMRRAQREATSTGDDSGAERTATPPNGNTTAFSLMTKKGNRQQASSSEHRQGISY